MINSKKIAVFMVFVFLLSGCGQDQANNDHINPDQEPPVVEEPKTEEPTPETVLEPKEEPTHQLSHLIKLTQQLIPYHGI